MRKSLYTRQYKQFVELLKEARKVAGLTQADVASALGKPQSFVAKYENGERRLDVVEFLTVAGAVKADPQIILRKLVATR